MGSCLSTESKSPRPGKRKNSKKKLGSRNSSFEFGRDEFLLRIPGRIFSNGSSDIASLFTQQGKKGTNQDAMIVWENFGSRTDTVFCGVFDGHGPYGHMVAKRVRDSLPLKLSAHWDVNTNNVDVLKEISLNTNGSMNREDTPFISHEEESRSSVDVDGADIHPEIFHALKESFLKAFRVMDRELRMHPQVDCFCSGTTAVTLIKQGQDLIIGNLGDSRAVLGTRDKDNNLYAVQLTVDLKPNLPAEEARIRKCRGRVFALQDEPEVSRVWLPNNDSPGLAMARAFGDFCLKDFGLISVPEISYRRITEQDEFVVLATDGIWDVLLNGEVVDIVASAPNRSHAARALVDSAVRAWRIKYPTSKIDDCAVVCLFFDSNSDDVEVISSQHKLKMDEVEASIENGDITGMPTPGFTRSGTVRTNPVLNGDESHEEHPPLEPTPSESAIDWSALEGVSRVNTLITLPRYVPENGDGKASGGSKARKG